MNPIPQLTTEELALLGNQDFFLKKSVIGKKIRIILETLHQELKPHVLNQALIAPDDFNPEAVQIVKGEHLEEHPYQYLDYPRHFSREQKLTFRSLVWWGHYFVFALILEGDLLTLYRRHLFNRYSQLADKGLSLHISPSLWEWKKGAGLTLDITSTRRSEIAAVLDNRPSFKISKFIDFQDPIVQSNRIVEEGVSTFQTMLPLITV